MFQNIDKQIGLRPGEVVLDRDTWMGRVWSFYHHKRNKLMLRTTLRFYSVLFEEHLLRETDTVLDVGAHIGYFAIPVSTLVNQVIAFEPAPGNWRLLIRNIHKNQRSNIQVRPQPVADRNGVMPFHLATRGTTGHSLYANLHSGVTRDMPVASFGTVVSGYRPAVVKLDCEGAEWPILAHPEWFENVRVVVAEMHAAHHHKKELTQLRKVYPERGFQYRMEEVNASWHLLRLILVRP